MTQQQSDALYMVVCGIFSAHVIQVEINGCQFEDIVVEDLGPALDAVRADTAWFADQFLSVP